LAIIVSCKKVITVTVNNATPVLVVQGNITNQTGPYTVKLTSSVYYSEDNLFPAITGAVVKITDDSTGVTDLLTEKQQGIYLTNTTIGAVNHTYHLFISTGGKEYTATSTMPKQVFLDSITFLTNTGFGQNVTNPLPNFQDPAGVYNAYRFIEWFNSKPSKQIFVFDDRLSDGKYVARQLFNDSSYIQPSDTVQLEMQCIDKNVYNYFKELDGTDPTNGQPTSPANPTSNVSNGALGYFSAHTVQTKRKVFTK
jgi:hypothetical protein